VAEPTSRIHDEYAGHWLAVLRDGDRGQKLEARLRLAPIFIQRGMLDHAAELYETNITEGLLHSPIRSVDPPTMFDMLAQVYRTQGRRALADQLLSELIWLDYSSIGIDNIRYLGGVSRMNRIVNAFRLVVERFTPYSLGVSEDVLPYPRHVIRDALLGRILLNEQRIVLKSLEVGLVALASYLPEPDGSIAMNLSATIDNRSIINDRKSSSEEDLRRIARITEFRAALALEQIKAVSIFRRVADALRKPKA
jgi:hypothetical protein